jgi:4-diphosphocytidyl-2-C-methyl-D-erythritol kinase
VRDALSALATAAGVAPNWRARIDKRIPVAAGLGGGSSDAAMSLTLANALLDGRVDDEPLHGIAASLGADVPFFLRGGAQLGTGDGTTLWPLDLPRDYTALVILPAHVAKASTGDVYRAFDERAGARGFEARRGALLEAVDRVERAVDLTALPPNDLARSPLADRLAELGAFRADVSGAGPAVYGLFEDERQADRASSELGGEGTVWIARPLGPV